eukprot:s1906_g10.t2
MCSSSCLLTGFLRRPLQTRLLGPRSVPSQDGSRMSRIGSCNFREKEKSFNTQEETWRQTCEKERFIEVLAHPPQTTFHDVAHSLSDLSCEPLPVMAVVDPGPEPERLGWFCCNRRAPKAHARAQAAQAAQARGEEKPQINVLPPQAPQPEEVCAEEPLPGKEEDSADAEEEEIQPSPVRAAERPDAETGSSGYFSNSNSSHSDSDASDPCFWKPRRLQSDSSAASATSSEYLQAEAQRREVERLTAQVPLTDAGKPTSVGSINHPSAELSGPTRSTAHTTHIGQNAQAAAAERPAGKPSAIGLHWGIQ